MSKKSLILPEGHELLKGLYSEGFALTVHDNGDHLLNRDGFTGGEYYDVQGLLARLNQFTDIGIAVAVALYFVSGDESEDFYHATKSQKKLWSDLLPGIGIDNFRFDIANKKTRDGKVSMPEFYYFREHSEIGFRCASPWSKDKVPLELEAGFDSLANNSLYKGSDWKTELKSDELSSNKLSRIEAELSKPFVRLNDATAIEDAIGSIGQSRLIVSDYSGDDETFGDAELVLKETLKKASELDTVVWFESASINHKKLLDKKSEFWGVWPGRNIPISKYTIGSIVATNNSELFGISLPIKESWQVAAFIGFGGWNSCPTTVEHCALWRYWEREYESHIVAVSHNQLEAHVRNPPKTNEQALKLAEQHFLYCNSTVTSGAETIAQYASTLVDSAIWSFSWDWLSGLE